MKGIFRDDFRDAPINGHVYCADAALERADKERFFQSIVEASPFMIWVSDIQGRCVYVNRKWIQITGLTFEESLGFGYLKVIRLLANEKNEKLFTDQENESRINAVHKLLAYQTKLRLEKPNGEFRWVVAQTKPFQIDGTFAGIIGNITDITDQEMAIQALKDLSDKKDEFISIASHELKIPLTSITGFTHMLLKSINKDSKGYVFSSKIREHIVILESRINDLLNVSKISAGKLIYQESVFTLKSLIDESIENVQFVSSNHEILVERPLPDIDCYGDKDRLEQVMNNFLTNAIKYSPVSSKIIVKSEVVDDGIKISVEDNGIGISDENVARLFDRFYRVNNSTMRFKGLGLGLYISSEIVKHHHGEIGVESAEGKGSVFWFKLRNDAGSLLNASRSAN